MAAAPPPGQTQPPVVTIPVSGASGIGDLTIPQVVGIPGSGVGAFGEITVTPPTFLEKWGIVFVAVAGGWVLAVCACMLWYYVDHLTAPPPQTASVNRGRLQDSPRSIQNGKRPVSRFPQLRFRSHGDQDDPAVGYPAARLSLWIEEKLASLTSPAASARRGRAGGRR